MVEGKRLNVRYTYVGYLVFPLWNRLSFMPLLNP